MRSFHIIAALGILVFEAACGGKVVIDRDGQGGNEPIDPGPSEVCSSYCSVQAELGCTEDVATCVSICKTNLDAVGSCAPSLGAVITCSTQNASPPPNCSELPPVCTDEVEAFQTCVASAPCTSFGNCQVSAGHCNCTNECSGALVESDCDTKPGGTCTCRFNGEVVGTCAPTYAKCDNLIGCCAGLFAASH
ncbi:hypothetical protein [Polyangium sp. y55x31]|uniref:hypothetical protein n=1 Tax=Polyangium sp. y55x31 TaxID=3042688 RepID=UPI002482DD94|nr:hypothetical protein [Polyangium sp. y55x31]MDI1482508.1 hypothetical protein [Polyangium sp. y55x31]